MAETSLNNYAKTIHDVNVANGWWDKGERNFGECIALMHSELSEALEEWRDGHAHDEVYTNPDKPGKLEGSPVEIVDCIIRCLDWLQPLGIDIDGLLQQKVAYNMTRGYKHGGKVA